MSRQFCTGVCFSVIIICVSFLYFCSVLFLSFVISCALFDHGEKNEKNKLAKEDGTQAIHGKVRRVGMLCVLYTELLGTIHAPSSLGEPFHFRFLFPPGLFHQQSCALFSLIMLQEMKLLYIKTRM